MYLRIKYNIIDKMASKYNCDKCSYTTDKKSNFSKHLNRKTSCGDTLPTTQNNVFRCSKCEYKVISQKGLTRHMNVCDGLNPLECPTCKATFTTRIAKNRHCKHVKCVAPYNATLNNTAVSSNVNIINNTTTNNINIVQNNNNSNNINITINAFGNENIDYIKNDPRFPNIFARILNKQGAGLCQYVMYKHFHPEHKENHTVRKMVKKDRVIEMFDGENWIPDMQDTALDNILTNIKSDYEEFIDHLFDSGNKIINKEILNKFMRNVGEAMELDVTGDHFDWNYDMPDDQKTRTRQMIYELLCTFIHTQSKKLFKDVLMD
jgi:predicted RNA-binding Zn-ribbon protein involved in translation (DUF1610 family)